MLAELPMLFALAGLAAYAVLAGADFGAGIWHMLPAGRRAAAVREHTHRSMSAVWEANHVWLIFVLVVCWTAYPVAFGSIASTLAVPLLHRGARDHRARHRLRDAQRDRARPRGASGRGRVRALLAAHPVRARRRDRRDRVGPGAGRQRGRRHLVELAQPDLGSGRDVGDRHRGLPRRGLPRRRRGSPRRTRPRGGFPRPRARRRCPRRGPRARGARGAGRRRRPLFEDLVAGAGLPALLVSVVAGIATLALVRSRRFEAARYSAGVAVAAIIAGWALAQQPTVLPGLTIEAAAAGDATLVATLIGLVVGLAIVLPSLFVLFRLVLRGRFDPAAGDGPQAAPEARAPIRPVRGVRSATAACLLAGVALMLFGGDLAGPIGAVALLAFCALGTVALLQPTDLAGAPRSPRPRDQDPQP